MSKITLLQVKTVEYRDAKHLKLLITKHKEQLGKYIMRLDSPGTIAIIQAIAYNLIHLTRELERRDGKRADLHILPGGKKD
jgi:hypothetical protein